MPAPRQRTLGRIALVATILVFAVGAFLVAREQATSRPEPLPAGARLGAFSLPTLEGGSAALAEAPGRTTVVAFVSATCSHCRDETRRLLATVADGTPVVVVEAAGSSRAEREAFAADALRPGVPLLLDDGAVARRAGVEAFPTVYVLDASGAISDGWVGARDGGACDASADICAATT